MKPLYALAAISLTAAALAGCTQSPAPAASSTAAPAAPAATAATAPAKQLMVRKMVAIDASADAVWAKAKDFGGLNTWHPAIARDEIVEGKDNEPGAVRQLTTKDGATIKEQLLRYDEASRSYEYAILESPLPITDYDSTLIVQTDGADKCTVSWYSSFKSNGKADDKTATDAVAGIYAAGLDNLKKLAESK